MPKNATKLYVSNLPAHVTDDDLKREFGNFGVVVVAFVIKDKKGQSRRFGFVSFRDATSTKCAACNVDRFAFGECKINVDFANELPVKMRRKPNEKAKNNNVDKMPAKPLPCSLENVELERRLLKEERCFRQARRHHSFAERTQLDEYKYFRSYPEEDYDYLRCYQREYAEPLSAPCRQRYREKYYYPREHREDRVVFLTDPEQKAAYRENPQRFIRENREFIERNAVYIESQERRVVYECDPRYYLRQQDFDPRLLSGELRANAVEFSPSPRISKEKEDRKSQIDAQTEASEQSREFAEGNCEESIDNEPPISKNAKAEKGSEEAESAAAEIEEAEK